MRDLLNFFISFEKLMKERLVVAFFWLSLIMLAMYFAATTFDHIYLGFLATVVDFFAFFVKFLWAIVGLRIVCELAIALFRINDNLSPDGGIGETADIDPITEARKAAEEAAKRAREMSSTVVAKSKSAVDTVSKKASDKTDDLDDKFDEFESELAEKVEDVDDNIEEIIDTSKYATDKDGNVIYNKDGRPRKKRKPRKKSS